MPQRPQRLAQPVRAPLPVLPYRKPTKGRDYWLIDDVLPEVDTVRERCLTKDDWVKGHPYTSEAWPGLRAMPGLEPAELARVERAVRQATGVEKLWKVPADGSRAPARMLDARSYRPAVSPDGTRVAFYYQERADSPFVLAVMPFNGDRPNQAFKVAPSGSSATVRWTADGKALLHNSNIGDRTNIWLQPLTGGPPRQVTHFVDQAILGFDRSTDGKRLIIARGILSRDAVMIRNFR